MDEGSQSAPRLRPSLDARRVLLLALVIAFGLQWKSCIEPNRINGEWREHAHWQSPYAQQFDPEDRLMDYQRFHSAPFGNALYTTLARTGIDATWGKINGIAWFALSALLVFCVARALAPGRIAGWAAAIAFILFPSQMKPFVGGLMPGLTLLILCLTLFLILTERWRWCAPLVLLQGLVDSSAAVHVASIVVLVGWRRQRGAAALSALACVAVFGAGYLFGSDEFGALVSRVEIGDRPEFSLEGRAELLPTPSIAAMLWKHLGSASYLTTCLAAFLILGRRMLALPGALYVLLLTSVGLSAVADVVLLHLGVPAQFSARGMPLFAALTTGVWIARMFARENRPRQMLSMPLVNLRASPAVLAVVLIGLIGLYEHRASFVPRGDLGTKHFPRTWLYAAIRALPEGSMLATHPRTASELPLMTGHSVVISTQLMHPWWTEYASWSAERVRDMVRAYYTASPSELLEVTEKYGIDYWVVDVERYSKRPRQRGMVYEPFVTWAYDNVRYGGYAALEHMPARYRLWDDGGAFFIVSADGIERRFTDYRRPDAPADPP